MRKLNMSCPSGVIYLTTVDTDSTDPANLLRPALDALLSLTSSSISPSPTFELFFTYRPQPTSTERNSDESLLFVPPLDDLDATVLTATSDRAARLAEEIVRKVTGDETVWEKEAEVAPEEPDDG